MKIKKLAAALAAFLMLPSCTASTGSYTEEGRLSIVTTNFAMYDFARAVAGDMCDVTMLIPPGNESHDFEATLADIAKISEADVFVQVGSEDWVEDAFSAMGALADEIVVVDAMEVIEQSGEALVYTDCVDEEHEHDHDHDEEADEHVWTSIGNAEILMNAIAEALLQVDSSCAETITKNKDAYFAQLDAIDAELYALTASEDEMIVVADRFPFAYMTARYGLAYEAAFLGCTSDTEPSLAVINTLIETVKSRELSVIFVTEGSDRKTAEAVAAETGAEILVLQSAQSISVEDFTNGVTYVDMMKQNLDALTAALGE